METIRRKPWEWVLIFGCCELLPLYRMHFGLGFAFGLGVLFVVKQQALQYLPSLLFIQQLHVFSGLFLAYHIVVRFFGTHDGVLAGRMPGNYSGVPLWRSLGMYDTFSLRWLEPFLALALAAAATMQGGVVPHFAPIYRFVFLPLPPGLWDTYPSWYVQLGVSFAWLYPLLMCFCLAIWNRIECEAREIAYGGKEPRAKRKRRKEPEAEEAVAWVPGFETAMQAPSAEAMARELEDENTL